MPAVWYIGQAAKRTVGVADWEDFGISNRPAITWEQENGWSVPHVQLTAAQLALLNNDPLFVVGAPDGPRTGMPAGVDTTDVATKGWTVEQIVQRLGERGSVADPDGSTGGGNAAADVPVGGFAGQVLTKISDLDFDAQWRTPAAGSGGGSGPGTGTIITNGDYWNRNQTSPVIVIGAAAPWPSSAPEGAVILRLSGQGV